MFCLNVPRGTPPDFHLGDDSEVRHRALCYRLHQAGFLGLLVVSTTARAAEASAVPVLAVDASLAAEAGRLDERLGILLQALEDPAIADEALARLTMIVVNAPPRAAWARAYAAALMGSDTGFEELPLRALTASLQLPNAEPDVWSTLEEFARADAPGARRAWGEALLFHGQLGRAEETALLMPEHQAWVRVARGQADQTDATRIDPTAQDCLQHNDDLTCGVLLLEQGWPGSALLRARTGLEASPENPDLLALIEHGERTLNGGPEPSSIQAAAQASELLSLGQSPESLAVLLEGCARHPASWEVLGPALRLAFDLGQTEVAVGLLQEALGAVRTPGGWDAMLQDLGRVTALAAEDQKSRGQTDSALFALQLAHVLLPQDPGILSSLGGTAWQLGRTEAALAAYSAAALLTPDDLDVLDARFRLLIASDRLDAATALLAEQPMGVAQVDALRQELSLEIAVRSVQAVLAAGDTAGALKDSELLLRRFEAWPRVQALRADALMADDRPQEAAELYERARRRDPSNPWHAVGEARALGQLGLWPQAHGLLDGLPSDQTDDLRAVSGALREELLRSEGDALRVSGDWEAAWARYDPLLTGDPGPWTLTGVGALYLAADRPQDALDAYEQALEADPDNRVPARGRIWAMLALGQVHEAEAAAQILVNSARDPASDSLLAQARRQRQLQEAQILRFSQRPEQAEDLLLEALEEYPADPDLTLALGWLYEQQGRTDDAWWRAKEVLSGDPTHLGALHLLRVVGRGRASAVHRAWQEAANAGADREVAKALPALRLAIDLERAEALAGRGLLSSARAIVAKSSKSLAGGDGRAWLTVGDAWTALGDLDQAWAAYELAAAHAPQDGEIVRRLARCLEACGRPAHAQRVLERHWSDYEDPRVGLALGELQSRRGLHQASKRTREQVRAAAGVAEHPTLPATSGGAETDPLVVSGTAGLGWFSRPGDPGTTQLTGWLVPIGAQLGLPGGWQLGLQAIPHWITDGESSARGASFDLGVSMPPGGAVSGNLSVSSGPLGSAALGRWGWDAGIGAALGGRGEILVGFHRAPVLDSLASWTGHLDILDRPYGGVSDTWVSGTFSLRWETATDLGLIVRAGSLAGDAVDPVGWQQAVGWGHRTLQVGDQHLRVGIEGLAMTHDRKSDNFSGGQAATFTPELFAQAIGRLEGTWRTTDVPIQVCGAVGLGAQYQDAESLRFQDTGWEFTSDAVLVAQWRLAPAWVLEVRAYLQATSTLWRQQVALLTLQRHGQIPPPIPPQPPFYSPVHSPPLVPHRPCSTVPREREE
jgi:tetratricopeptide (TPR) repeat protein